MRRFVLTLLISFAAIGASVAQEQLKKVYDEDIDRMEQIDNAIAKAKAENKYVLCQVGGNWCPWCLRFADFVTKDAELASIIGENYVYIHVNYSPKAKRQADHKQVMSRLGNPVRFGMPVFVLLRSDGSILHIQDSVFLEEGKSYNKKSVARFLNSWTPKAVEAEE